MTDFLAFTEKDAALFVVSYQHDLGAAGITKEDVIDRLSSGAATLELRPYGLAIIEVNQTDIGRIPFLWILFVDPDSRGQKLGTQFVRELKTKYCETHHMSVTCYGSRRRAFFGRLGFRIESRDGETRRMTTNPMPYR